MDLGEHTVKRRLVSQPSAQDRLAIGIRVDRQRIEPFRPAFCQMAFHADLVKARLIHIYWANRGRRSTAQERMASQSRWSPCDQTPMATLRRNFILSPIEGFYGRPARPQQTLAHRSYQRPYRLQHIRYVRAVLFTTRHRQGHAHQKRGKGLAANAAR